MPELPTGTVTMLFTDVEGSTRLLERLGPERYREALDLHRRLLRQVFERHGGYEVDYEGDAFFVTFVSAHEGAAAACEGQQALARAEWRAGGELRVRMGVHTGEPVAVPPKYVGLDVHKAARIMAAGHGGQVLLSQATAVLAGADVRDLGLHRLKDLSAPERLFQLGTDIFPPLKTLHETNLPVPATPFLGREREIDELAVLLLRLEVRLVTLTGPGGSGKTRLALQSAAAAADDYDRGVWWVPLASLSDPALVETSASRVLGSKDTLSATVGDKRLLLVLDNFEHLLDAAAGIAETLGSCPRLTVLVTSREPLHVDGEWEVAVDPLCEQEAVELFLQRAAAVRSRFAANGEVVEICRRLDCLPLAIELAVARVKALSLPALLERLEQRLPVLGGGSRSAPERQRTLHATIAWSHDLLTPAEQDLFARLAVFAGGCTLDAAEQTAAPISTRSPRWSTRASYVAPATATGCSRRSASSRTNGSTSSRMDSRSGTVTRPGMSRSASVRALSCGRGRLGRGSSGSTPSTQICGRRSSTCSTAGTRTVRCDSRARSGRTGRHADTGPRGGAT
jgi:class 3 adenylate cyclase